MFLHKLSGTEGVVNQWVGQEKFDTRAIDALRIIAECLSLEYSSKDGKLHTFLISHPDEDYNLTIELKVIKGSIMTTLWNRSARFDEEFQAVLISHVAKYSILHKVSSARSSQSSSAEGSESGALLLHARGVDPVTCQLLWGEVEWHSIDKVMDYLGIDMVGVSAFASLLGQLLLFLPLYHRDGSLHAPMPAMWMMRYLTSHYSRPLLSPPGQKRSLQRAVESLRTVSGAGRELRHYALYWLQTGHKVLHRTPQPSPSPLLAKPLHSFSGPHSSKGFSLCRVVEVFGVEYEGQERGMGVVEVTALYPPLSTPLNPIYTAREPRDLATMKTSRYVVLDVERLVQAIRVVESEEEEEKEGDRVGRGGGEDIPVLDEAEWHREVVDKYSTGDCHQVIFRQCSEWGAQLK